MEYVNKALQWISDFFSSLWLIIWQKILEGLASVLNAIPVPDFFYQASGALSGFPPQLVFALDVLQFDLGLPMILSAYGIRFLIRRIPIIG